MQQLQPILCTDNGIDEQIFLDKSLHFKKVQQQNYTTDRMQSQDNLLPINSMEHKQGSLVQYFHVRTFVQKMLKKKKYLSNFTIYHFNLIADKAASFNLALLRKHALQLKSLAQTVALQSQKSKIGGGQKDDFDKKQNKSCQTLLNIIEKIPLTHPDSKWKVRWDCLILFARCYFMCIVPIDLAWEQQQVLYGTLIIPTIISMTLLIVDLLFSFFQCFYLKGQLIIDRTSIFYHVILKSYCFELASIFIIIIFLILQQGYEYQVNLSQDPYYLLLLTSFVQYKNIAKIREQLEDALNLSKAASSMVELLKLFFLLFYVIHIFACLWFWVGQYSTIHLQKSWLLVKEVQDQPIGTQYLYSVYFSTVTMFTVGYGDITPQAEPEFIVSILFMMVCSIQLSYSVSTVGSIIDKISSFKEIQKKKISILNNYMEKKKISYELQFQVRQYLNYFWQKEDEETQEENDIIMQISETLRNKLIYEANSRVLNDSPIFKNHFSSNFKKKLVSKVKSINLQPEQIIEFEKLIHHRTNNECLCFVEEGKLEEFIENDGNQLVLARLAILEAGQTFGYSGFLLDQPTKIKYKTLDFTKLLIIPRRDFIKVIADFPKDYEKFCEIRDNYQISQMSSLQAEKCQSCQSRQHQTSDCPMIHFVVDKELTVKRITFNFDQQRAPYKRNYIRQKMNTLQGIKITQKYAKQIIDDEFIEGEIYDIEDIEDIEVQQPKLQSQKTQIIIKKKTKRSHTNLKKTYLIKLRRAVKKLKIILFWSNRLVDKNRKNLSYQSQQQDLQSRMNKLKYIQGEQSQEIIESIYFIQRKIKLLNSQEIETDFDKLSEFTQYKPIDNIEKHLLAIYSLQDHIKEKSDILNNLRQKLLKYITYPQIYIMKYKYPKSLTMMISLFKGQNKQLLKYQTNTISGRQLKKKSLKKRYQSEV